MYLKLKCVLLLLLFCYSFVNGGDTKGYPREINCIINKYVAGFPNVKKYYEDVKKNHFHLWETDTKSNINIKSIEVFQLENEKGIKFSMDIWTMETNEDANKLFIVNKNEKPPKRYFVYENFFILLTASSVSTRYVIQEGVSKIIQTCFECGTIDVGFTLAFVGDEEGCGKLIIRKKPGPPPMIIFPY